MWRGRGPNLPNGREEWRIDREVSMGKRSKRLSSFAEKKEESHFTSRLQGKERVRGKKIGRGGGERALSVQKEPKEKHCWGGSMSTS